MFQTNGLGTMQETEIVTEISVNNEACIFACFYRWPSQHYGKLNNFCPELDLILTNTNNNQPTCSDLIGDFNIKSSKYDKNNIEDLEFGNIPTTRAYSQDTNKPTHVIKKNFFLY